MKCDHIRTRKQGDTPFFPNMLNNGKVEICLKEDVDAAIAELKAKLDKAIAERDGNQVCIDALKAKFEDVNELIKIARQMLEDAKATHCAEMVDAGMRERRLNRALWLARALRAKECKYKYETWERHEERKVYKDYDMIAIVSRKARMWRKVERKCRAKAEEYK